MKTDKNNMNLDLLFPTIIGVSDCDFHKKIEKLLVKHCLTIKKNKNKGGTNWISNSTYNTSLTYDLFTDPKFHKLNVWISEQVNQFVSQCKYASLFKPSTAWINVYEKNDYQEYHTHPNHSISAIYFLKSNAQKNSKTWFESPIKLESNDPKANESHPITWNRVGYEAVAGRLLLFRSNVRHCVERENHSQRISLAYNFNLAGEQ
tara:strand:- start:2008 stop:2622 length:615 start_codon:yes stop_codon:yes gene_type:complete